MFFAKTRVTRAAMVAAGVLFAASSVAASDLSDADILAAADSKRGAQHGVFWGLTVAEKGGASSMMDVTARDEDFLAVYKEPAAQRGEKILERGQNMWFVKPGTSNPIPISPRQKLLGAASYGDIAAQRWTTDYKVTGRSDGKVGDEAVIVFELKGNEHATYDMITLYVDANDHTAIKSEMKSAEGKLLKTATYAYDNKAPGRYEAAKDMPDDSEFISMMTIMPADGGKETTLTYSAPTFKHVSAASFELSNVME